MQSSGEYYIPGLGPVRVTAEEANQCTRNETMEGHQLHPSAVTRCIRREGDKVYIDTHGVGIGPMLWLNERLAPFVWKPVDYRVFEYLNPALTIRP